MNQKKVNDFLKSKGAWQGHSAAVFVVIAAILAKAGLSIDPNWVLGVLVIMGANVAKYGLVDWRTAGKVIMETVSDLAELIAEPIADTNSDTTTNTGE